jgi:hypothetical protein
MFAVNVDDLDSHGLVEHFSGKRIFSPCLKWLALFRRVDPGKTHLMLDSPVVENSDGVAVGNRRNFANQDVPFGGVGETR